MTFTEQARRTQIVEAAIAVIAEVGYPKASFAKIAKRAGIKSTGIISYHFASKQDLDAHIVAQILGTMGEWMHQRMQVATSPQVALSTYIESVVTYMHIQEPRMRALSSMVLHGAMEWGDEQEETAITPLEEILRWGQAEGVFRDFDPSVMATTIQRSLDGIPFLQAANPALDLPHYASELVTTFALATRRTD